MSHKIIITDDMKRGFRDETGEHLNTFEKMLMILEKEPHHAEAIRIAFRSIHSIKGNSDYLGVGDINRLAHELEDIMDALRNSSITLSDSILNILFEAADILRDMNRRIADNDYQETDLSGILPRIRQLKLLSAGEETAEPLSASDMTHAFSEVFDNHIRVDLGKIDKFMTHVSEFVIAKNALRHIAGKRTASETFGKDLVRLTSELDKIAGSLQSDVVKLRLVKIGSLFERLPRIVREFARESRKHIRLVVSGEETETDCRIIRHLADPLVQIIRNAADHGIEPPEERIRLGKNESGTITIAASCEDNHVIIGIGDDGMGIDTDKIVRQALKQHLIGKDSPELMTAQDMIQMVFIPGLSSRTEASRFSGRGVGLDIVKSNIENIGGQIHIASEPGQGTQVRFRIPISMTFSDVLLTDVNGRQYAFPLSSVLKTLKIGKKDMRGFGRHNALLHDNRLFVLKYLGEILDIPNTADRRAEDEINVVLTAFGDRNAGIIVDSILRRESIIAKPMFRHLPVREFSSTALMEDGSIALVINPAGIFQRI